VDKGNKVVLEGSSAILTEYYQRKLSREDIKIAYFGDAYMTDIHATHQFSQKLKSHGNKASWEGIAVIEELSAEDRSFEEGVSARLVPHNEKIWGKSYFYDDFEGKVTRNFFVSEMDKVARYAVPFVKNIKYLLR